MIRQFLIKHSNLETISFHMPGHKGGRIFDKYGYSDFFNRIMDLDITEIPGADNLFQSEGIIKATMDKYSELYDVKQSYLLINGSSGGIIAAIMASVRRGNRILMARNCHRSVFNALTLADIKHVYAYPEIVDGVSGQIKAKEIEHLILEYADIDAVILPSPNYYGICSDIKSIAGICKRYGKVLIVDQAHGAHLKFFNDFGVTMEIPQSAEGSGADITINSTHKTLASMTQSAVLNFNTDKVDKHILEEKLQLVQSTSPSYVLMASLDINADLLINHGKNLILEWEANLNWFYENIVKIPFVKVMKASKNYDSTKINLDLSAFNMDGANLERYLITKNIVPELFSGNVLMCMSGIGNTREDLKRLLSAIQNLADQRPVVNHQILNNTITAELWNKRREIYDIPGKEEWIPLREAVGKICASSIIPYPPGVPFLCPGEKIGKQEADFINELQTRGEKVIGVDNKGKILVGLQ